MPNVAEGGRSEDQALAALCSLALCLCSLASFLSFLFAIASAFLPIVLTFHFFKVGVAGGNSLLVGFLLRGSESDTWQDGI